MHLASPNIVCTCHVTTESVGPHLSLPMALLSTVPHVHVSVTFARSARMRIENVRRDITGDYC